MSSERVRSERSIEGLNSSWFLDRPAVVRDDNTQRAAAWVGFAAEIFVDTESEYYYGVAYLPVWGSERNPHVVAASADRRQVFTALWEESKSLAGEMHRAASDRPLRPGEEWLQSGAITDAGEYVTMVVADELGTPPFCRVLARPTPRADA